MADIEALMLRVRERFSETLKNSEIATHQLTIEIDRAHLLQTCRALRDEPDFLFEILLDVCGVDYLDYGISEWETDSATAEGFSRGVEKEHPERVVPWDKPRFAVVYHLLSLTHNHRIRLRVFAEDESPRVDSVIGVWQSADWYEREAFDLFGIVFDGHPDLRRILTDYDFVGHPFRKDFPLIGHVEVRYDAALGKVIYEPVNIQPRVLVPKVIREDSRYE